MPPNKTGEEEDKKTDRRRFTDARVFWWESSYRNRAITILFALLITHSCFNQRHGAPFMRRRDDVWYYHLKEVVLEI